MKFNIHFVIKALALVWTCVSTTRPKADQHHDPVAAAPYGALFSILTSAR
ncbi:hypothetical protein [Rhodoferax sp. GW822-FHT02A01]